MMIQGYVNKAINKTVVHTPVDKGEDRVRFVSKENP